MRLNSEKGILVVDDSPDDLCLICKYLLNQGYYVRPVMSAAAALNAVENKRPDLILLDVRMPEMDGFELCRRLKADEKTADIPVIYLSAANEAEHVVKGLNSGAVDYIAKPVEEEELVARIRVHLAICHMRQELENRNAKLQEINQQLEQSVKRYPPSRNQPKDCEDINRQLKAQHKKSVKLTPRELECLSLLAQGKRTGQIADQLDIKPVTVEFHLSNTRNKLAAKTREQALVSAIALGLMEPSFD